MSDLSTSYILAKRVIAVEYKENFKSHATILLTDKNTLTKAPNAENSFSNENSFFSFDTAEGVKFPSPVIGADHSVAQNMCSTFAYTICCFRPTCKIGQVAPESSCSQWIASGY